ncbi:MAG: hypothetical protein LQ350_003611 [Teloschistes chrysophthalmus]|nr:MAG: hypothetical protein LQ350_003611 [Niorma chrysophthalma]
MGDSPKITISADGHYHSTGELPSERPFDTSDANASNTSGENHVIHKSIERDFVNDEKGQATDQAGVQTPKTDSKGKATDHGETQAAGQTGENTAAEAEGEKKKKRHRVRKPKKSNAATQQEDEIPSSPVTPASGQSTTPVTASKPSGVLPASTPQTATDNTKPARLFSIPVAPAKNPEMERFLHGPLPPAKSPFPLGPHGWMSTSNDGFNGLLPSGAGGSIPPAAPATGAGAASSPSAVASLFGAGGSIPPAASPTGAGTSIPTAAHPTDQAPAEASVPLRVQGRKIHRIRRLENRKANAGNAEPTASNVWDTEGSSSGLGGSIPPADPPSGVAGSSSGPGGSIPPAAVPAGYGYPEATAADMYQARYLALYNKTSDIEAKNLRLKAENTTLVQTVLEWSLMGDDDKSSYEALLQSHRELEAQITALKGQHENSSQPGAVTEFKGDGTAEEHEGVEDPKNVQKDLKDLDGSAVNLAERVDELDKKVGEQDLEIETLKQEKTRLEKDLRDEQKKNEESETSRKLISEDADKLKKDCEKFEQKLNESDKKLKAAEKEIDGLKTTVRERDAEILQQEKTINQTAAKLQKLEDSRDKYEEEIEGYRKELKDLKDELRDAKAERKRLDGVIKGQDAQIRDQDTEISNLKQGIKQQDGLKATIKDLEGQIKDLETELQQARTLPTATKPKDPDHSSEMLQKLKDEHEKEIQALRDEHARGKAFDTELLERECTLHERALRSLEEDVEHLRTRCGSLELANKDYHGQIDKLRVALEERAERADANPGPSNTSPAASQAGNDLEGIPDQSHADDPESDEDDFSDSSDHPSFRSRQARRAHDRRRSLSSEPSPLSPRGFTTGPQRAMTSVGTQTDAEATTTTDDKPGPMESGPIPTIDIESIEGAPPTTTVVPIKKTGWNSSWRWWCCLALLLVVVAGLAVWSSARREIDMWAQANHHVSRETLSSFRGGRGPGGMGWLRGDGVAEYGPYY